MEIKRVKGFFIVGMLYNYDLGLSPHIKNPTVIAHIDSKTFYRIENKINNTSANEFYEV